jgi:ABC-type nitrate/sulfonate/bicarbonate transport system substrate-binding protein
VYDVLNGVANASCNELSVLSLVGNDMARHRSRRQLIKGGCCIVGALMLANCGRGSGGKPPKNSVTTQLGWLNSMEWAGVYVADKLGFFSKEGIAVNFSGGGPNAPSVPQSLSGGAAKFGVGSVFAEVASAAKAGSDLIVLGAIQQRGAACIISLPSKPLTSAADLVGKRIGASNTELASATLRGVGLPNVRVVKVGGDIAPLLEGDVDGYIGYASNQAVELRARGMKPVVLLFEDLGMPAYGGLIVTTRATLAHDRPLVRGYLRALVKGHEMNLRDPALGAKIAQDDYLSDQGLDPKLALDSNMAYIAFETSDMTRQHGLCWIDVDRVDGPIYRSLALAGLTGLPAASSYVDMSVLEEVYASQPSLPDRAK